MLTNLKTVKQRLKRLKEIEAMEEMAASPVM